MSALLAKVRAGFRIHLGFYRFSDPPYIYGSLGAAVQEPYLTLTFIKMPGSSGAEVVAPTETSRRIVKEVVERLRVPLNGKIVVEGYVKHHVGLGTRTRVILSMLKALQVLGLLKGDLASIARDVGLGKYSSVGIYTFLEGGVVIDSGITSSSSRYPEIMGRFDPPPQWRVIISLPKVKEGLSEASEAPIMENPAPHPKQRALYTYLQDVIKGLREGDFELFTKGVEGIQALTGEYFASFQEGIFCCEESARIAHHLKALGASGIGQSSWGPLIYGFAPSPDEGSRIGKELKHILHREGLETDVWVTKIPREGFRVLKA